MALPNTIKTYLERSATGYSHKIHAVAFTSLEIAAVDHIPGGELAKTVVLRADGRLIMAVLPGDRVINLQALKQAVGCNKLLLASEKEFIEEFPECQPGSMPPFGRLFRLDLYCDRELALQPEIEFNAGTHIDTIRMKFSDFAQLETPIMLDFSEKFTGRPRARTA